MGGAVRNSPTPDPQSPSSAEPSGFEKHLAIQANDRNLEVNLLEKQIEHIQDTLNKQDPSSSTKKAVELGVAEELLTGAQEKLGLGQINWAIGTQLHIRAHALRTLSSMAETGSKSSGGDQADAKARKELAETSAKAAKDADDIEHDADNADKDGNSLFLKAQILTKMAEDISEKGLPNIDPKPQ